MDRYKKAQMRKESLDRTRQEMLAERAAALARITRTLERQLGRLEQMRHHLPTVTGPRRAE